jgi:hypothetical protein
MRIMVGVEDLVQRTGDGHIGRVLGGWTIRRSGDAVCSLHHARGDEEREFLNGASKPRLMVCQWFGLKTTRTVSHDLATKPMVGFLVEPQNQGSGGFLGLSLKTGSYGLVIWASKSP